MGDAMEILAANYNLTVIFGGMLFLVWVLPGLVCRKGKFPEDIQQRQKA